MQAIKRQRYSIDQKESQTQTLQTESINYDPETGRKSFATKKTVQLAQTSSYREQREQHLELIKQQRTEALDKFGTMSDAVAKARSLLFHEYDSCIRSAVNRFRKRTQNMVNVFEDPQVFGSIAFSSDQEDRFLLCLWTWREILQFGTNDAFVHTFIQQNAPLFFVTSQMVANHTLGRLLWHHIPLLEKLRPMQMELPLAVFEDLSIPPDHSPNLVKAVFHYDFSSREDIMPEDKLLSMQMATNCALNGVCWIPVDGPLTKLFSPEPSNAILHHVEHIALTSNVPKKQPSLCYINE
jgi:hypothetical protein